MRAVVQRVDEAQVTVEGEVAGAIGRGLLVLLAVEASDQAADLELMAKKLTGLRIFADGEGKMNLSVLEAGGKILLVSQFTLYGDCRKGHRPSFSRAAGPAAAEASYLELASRLRSFGVPVETGRFQAMMKVGLVNDGPVTVIIDSNRDFY